MRFNSALPCYVRAVVVASVYANKFLNCMRLANNFAKMASADIVQETGSILDTFETTRKWNTFSQKSCVFRNEISEISFMDVNITVYAVV